MALLWKPLSFLLLIAFILSNCFTEFLSDAQLIPQNEVKILQIISNNLKNSNWKNITQKSCTDGGRSFNPMFIGRNTLSNVTCDYSFNKGTVCHVTDIYVLTCLPIWVLTFESGNAGKT